MQYISTRDKNQRVSAAQAIAMGIAPDGGLFCPTEIPKLTQDDIRALCEKDYRGRSAAVIGRFLEEFSEEELTAAKEALLSNLRATHDAPGAIEGYYASAAVSGIGMTPAEFMEAIERVTAEDVREAAKTLTLCAVYFLKGDA